MTVRSPTSSRMYWGRIGSLRTLSQIVVERDGQIAHLNQVIADLESSLAEKEQQNKELHHVVERLNAAEKIIAEIFSSRSWRVTEPLRALRRCLKKKPQQQSESIANENVVMLDAAPVAASPNEQEKNSVVADPDFDAEFYRKAYPDTCGLDPYFHYSKHGKREGRLPCAPCSVGINELNNLDRIQGDGLNCQS